MTHLLRLLDAFPYNSYLHSHVLQTLCDQLARREAAITDAVMGRTDLLERLAGCAQMVGERRG